MDDAELYTLAHQVRENTRRINKIFQFIEEQYHKKESELL